MRFTDQVRKGQSDEHITWLYNYGIIRLYRSFESLMLDCLVAAINNDTSTLSSITGVGFPKHLTDEVCEFLIVGTGYFDFKGREGLVKTIQKFVPSDHYLTKVLKDDKYKDALEKLSALRNFAAHESAPSKRATLAVIGVKRISSSGAWLKRQTRSRDLVLKLKDLGNDLATRAPY